MSLFDHMNIFADIATCHRGDRDTFIKLCAQIEEAGAIVKLQLYNETTFPRDWARHLLTCNFVPSVFRPEDVDFVLNFGPRALKVASVEATFSALISRCLQETHLPLIVSTGGMDEDEIGNLLEQCEGHPEVCLMHCVSIYPTPKEKLNLGRLARLSEELEGTNIVIGWSSHYPVADAAAYALAWAWGATQFEVHVRKPKHMLPTVFEKDFSLDEQCAFPPSDLRKIRNLLKSFPVLEGSDDYTGPDRDDVLKWRQRWQTKK